MNELCSTLCEPLAQVIDRWTQGISDASTPVPGLTLFRRERVLPPDYCIIPPSIVVVVQGEKQMLVGDGAFSYDASRYLITSLDLPASSVVVQASPDVPCLGLAVSLDLRTIAELIAHGSVPLPRERAASGSIGIGALTPAILKPIGRLLELLDEPAAISTLAPIFLRELHYRLLTSDQAGLLRQIASVDGQAFKIARSIDWIKLNYAAPLRIEDLAASVQMSAPNFHHHFRQLTAMSPLQYQKLLRLNEAKRLMLNERLDAASAAFQVGYESPSQFSREYSRHFGAPPGRDIATLLAAVSVAQPKRKVRAS